MIWHFIYEKVRLGEFDLLNNELIKNGLHLYASLFTGVTPRSEQFNSIYDDKERNLNDASQEDVQGRLYVKNLRNAEFGNANWALQHYVYLV